MNERIKKESFKNEKGGKVAPGHFAESQMADAAK